MLTEHGAVFAWGTYRDATGVYGFSSSTRIALLPTLVWDPTTSGDQAVKIASGKPQFRSAELQLLLGSIPKGLRMLNGLVIAEHWFGQIAAL